MGTHRVSQEEKKLIKKKEGGEGGGRGGSFRGFGAHTWLGSTLGGPYCGNSQDLSWA